MVSGIGEPPTVIRHRAKIWPAAVAAALLCGLGVSAGCTRTSDGTIVPMQPVGFQNLSLGNLTGWLRQPAQKQEDTAQLFPVVPPPPVVEAESKPNPPPRQRQRRKVRRSAPAKPVVAPVAAPKPLACRNVSKPNERVRVVCE